MSGSESLTNEEDERAEGKGSGPDDDDDPADGFEDGADSQQLSDAQATVDQFVDDEDSDVRSDDGQTPVSGVETNIETGDTEETVSDSGSLKTLDDVNVANTERLIAGIQEEGLDANDDAGFMLELTEDTDNVDEAKDLVEERLSPEEIDAVIEKVQSRQELRQQYEEVSDVSELEPGQRVLYDGDRPISYESTRGTVEDIDATTNAVEINDETRGEIMYAPLGDGELYADPNHESSGGEFDASNHEPGRFGLASNEEVLNNAFSVAEERNGARKMGVTEGNTTGHAQEILVLEDGSRIYATPVSAYEGGTSVVSSKQEGVDNNLRSPKIINALGGNACDTTLVTDKFGEEYISKEGVEGKLAKDVSSHTVADDAIEDTMAAAYFVGNNDLHNANVMVTENGNLSIIDNDSAGYKGRQNSHGVLEISNYVHGPTGLFVADGEGTREKIYDTAVQIRSGEQEIPVDEGTEHYQYAQDAANKAVRAATVDPSYDVPDEHTPSNLKSAPDGYESFSDFSEGEPVTVVSDTGDKIECEVSEVKTDADSGSESESYVRVNNRNGVGGMRFVETENLNRIVDVG